MGEDCFTMASSPPGHSLESGRLYPVTGEADLPAGDLIRVESSPRSGRTNVRVLKLSEYEYASDRRQAVGESWPCCPDLLNRAGRDQAHRAFWQIKLRWPDAFRLRSAAGLHNGELIDILKPTGMWSLRLTSLKAISYCRPADRYLQRYLAWARSSVYGCRGTSPSGRYRCRLRFGHDGPCQYSISTAKGA